jgi:hypothetical protein
LFSAPGAPETRKTADLHQAGGWCFQLENFCLPLGHIEGASFTPMAKQSSSTAFDELILLIAASVPQLGAIVSTFLLDLALDLNRMNAKLSPTLQMSGYSSAYLYNMMGKGGPSVY